MDRRRSNVARTQIFIRVGEKNFTGNSRTQWYVGTIAWLPTNDFSAPPLWPNRGLHLYGVVPMRLYFSFIYFAVLNVVTGRGLRWKILQIHSRCCLNFIPIGFGGCFESSATWWCGWFLNREVFSAALRSKTPARMNCFVWFLHEPVNFFAHTKILQVQKSGFHMLDRMVLVIWFLFFLSDEKKHVMPCFTDFFRGGVSFRGNNEWVQLWWDQPNIWTSSMCQWF